MLVNSSVSITVFKSIFPSQSQGRKGEVCNILHDETVGDGGADILEHIMN